MKVNTRRAVFEFMSIVIAVVLAMTLTEWRQDYLNKQLAEKSFANIVEEIQENLGDLRSDSVQIAKDRSFMTEWVKTWVAKDSLPTFSASFSLSILSTAAYEVAQLNQSMTHLDNEQNMNIAEIYGLQTFYASKASEIFDLMGELQAVAIKPESDEFFEVVQKLRYRLNLVFNTVRAYIRASEDFLDQYPVESE